MIVRCGLAELPGVLDELSISRPLLISTERWRHVQAIAERPPAKANPRPAPPDAVLELLQQMW